MTNNAALAFLVKRLADLGHTSVRPDADDCRAAILGLLCAEAVAGRVPGEDKKLHTFRSLYAHCFGHELDARDGATRERAARVGKRKAV